MTITEKVRLAVVLVLGGVFCTIGLAFAVVLLKFAYVIVTGDGAC